MAGSSQMANGLTSSFRCCATNASIIRSNINSQFSQFEIRKIICSIHATYANGENQANIYEINRFFFSLNEHRERRVLRAPFSKQFRCSFENLKLHFSCVSFKRWFRLDLWYKLAIFAHYIATFCACTNLNRNHKRNTNSNTNSNSNNSHGKRRKLCASERE